MVGVGGWWGGREVVGGVGGGGGSGVFRSDCRHRRHNDNRATTGPNKVSNLHSRLKRLSIAGLIPTLTSDLRWDLTSRAAMLPYCASKRSENSRYLSQFALFAGTEASESDS